MEKKGKMAKLRSANLKKKQGKMAKLRSTNLKKKKGKMANPGQNVCNVVS